MHALHGLMPGVEMCGLGIEMYSSALKCVQFFDSGFRFWVCFSGFSIPDSGLRVRVLVVRFRIQVFGSGFWFFDSGFRFLGPIFGFPIQD